MLLLPDTVYLVLKLPVTNGKLKLIFVSLFFIMAKVRLSMVAIALILSITNTIRIEI